MDDFIDNKKIIAMEITKCILQNPNTIIVPYGDKIRFKFKFNESDKLFSFAQLVEDIHFEIYKIEENF